MKTNQKFVSGLLIGAAAGAVITHFLQSEQGKTVVKNAKSSVQNVIDDLKNQANQTDATAADSWINKGKNWLNKIINGATQNETVTDYEEIFS